MKEGKMAKSKVISSKTMTPVRGGKGHMFGKQHAGPKKPGMTGKANTSDGGKFAKGGPTGKVGTQKPSRPSRPGVSR